MNKTVAFVVTVLLHSNISSAITNDTYLINTRKCTIPDLPPFYPNWMNFTPSLPIPCSNLDPLLTYTTVENNIATLHIREDAILKHFGNKTNVSCCYSNVTRQGSLNFPDVGIVVSYCRQFRKSIELHHDTVWVSCSHPLDNLKIMSGFPIFPLYTNIHQIVRRKPNLIEKAEFLKQSSNKKPINVLIVVIDAVSRLNFIRTMPKTRNFIMENGFYEFKGYNKVDDNTFPNAMALFSGMNLNDSMEMCKPRNVDGLNYCPLIWYNYRNLGFITAYAEDWSDIATFNYLKKGFKEAPTDYYFKPYMDALRYLETKIQDTMPFCSGPESQGDRILNIAYDFVTSMKDVPNFGVFWMNTFSHNVITTPKTMDDKVAAFFEKLKCSGVLEENVVVLLSDHGIRFGEIMNTTRGYYEVRLPMNYIHLPSWFKTLYPDETRNFGENTKVLTSTNYSLNPSLACPNCRSLFENIPLERSCLEAGIPEKWCTCNLDLDLDED